MYRAASSDSAVRRLLLLAIVVINLLSCAPQSRMGMVVDPETGLQMGSVVEKNLVLSPAQLENRRIKLNIRNTSGDPAFDLHGFRSQLEAAYAAKGFSVASGDDLGLLVDVNVRYSGQASQNYLKEFAFLGGAGGGLGGYQATRGVVGTASGAIAGATLGAILGSYVREETYIVVADVVVGVMDASRGTTEKTIVFGASPTSRSETERRSGVRPFSQQLSTGVAVYAGGRNAPQSRIAEGVRNRFVRILSDVI